MDLETTFCLLDHHARTKHMELDAFFVREKVLTKQLVVQHIPGTDQWEDLLTKPLSSTRFTYLSSKLNVAELPLVSHRVLGVCVGGGDMVDEAIDFMSEGEMLFGELNEEILNSFSIGGTHRIEHGDNESTS